jgi:hypothetical protein
MGITPNLISNYPARMLWLGQAERLLGGATEKGGSLISVPATFRPPFSGRISELKLNHNRCVFAWNCPIESSVL